MFILRDLSPLIEFKYPEKSITVFPWQFMYLMQILLSSESFAIIYALFFEIYRVIFPNNLHLWPPWPLHGFAPSKLVCRGVFRSAVLFSRIFWGFAPPPINIIMLNTLGKTHIKKWSDEWSEPLRKKNLCFKRKLSNLPKHKKN